MPSFLLVFSLLLAPAPPAATPEWIEVDYGPLVDRTRLAQSGETVASLLAELGGRSLPPPGERERDFAIHRLLDPLLERHAFLLSDAVDTITPPPSRPWVEIAGLFERGERQPAWVELLRARRFVLESDGEGRLRAFVPLSGEPKGSAAEAAKRGWEEAWPVLRHPLAAERRRLAARRRGEPPALEIEVRAFRHRPEATRFDLGLAPWVARIADTLPRGDRPPLDLAALARVLSSPVRLEGGRLEEDGSIRWFTSEAESPSTLLGETLSLADAAVAYRAVFHGGLAEPYMSLDKGDAPWNAAVGYGGRLRDTAIGEVSLLCDVRFKTASVGIDPIAGEDLRASIRRDLPGFATHLERFAWDEGSAGIGGQQTRFWFYPDDVEFALSPGSDVFAIRRARMAAASERVRLGARLAAAGADAPWTAATVSFLNANLDALGARFPEIADLDRSVRLLSAFAWLRAAEEAGVLVPDLDALLAIELPAIPSPETFPQLLTRDVLPTAGKEGPVAVLDQSWVGEGLDRLRPRLGTFAARRRLTRALALLDRRDPDQAAEAAEIEKGIADVENEGDVLLLAERAERVAMHRRVLSLVSEKEEGTPGARVFSVGIGGIDLGTASAIARAPRNVEGLGWGRKRKESPPLSGGRVHDPREGWRRDPPGLPGTALPDHGLAEGESRETSRHRFARGVFTRADGNTSGWEETRLGTDGPGATLRRRIQNPEGKPAYFLRIEEGRYLPYRLAREGNRLAPELAIADAPPEAFGPVREPGAAGEIPPGLVLLEVLPIPFAGGTLDPAAESATLRLRRRDAAGRDQEAEIPRVVLQRLVLGPRFEPEPRRPLPIFTPAAGILGEARSAMIVLADPLARPAWEAPPPAVPGEEDAVRLAPALESWWNESGTDRRAAVVGTDRARSPGRWAAAPRGPLRPSLRLPEGAFPPSARDVREILVGSRPERDAGDAKVVLLVSGEAPGILAERLRAIAKDPSWKGKALAVLALSGPMRPDLPASLLAEGNLTALGVAEPSVPAARRAAREAAAWAEALARAPEGAPIEGASGPFVWFY